VDTSLLCIVEASERHQSVAGDEMVGYDEPDGKFVVKMGVHGATRNALQRTDAATAAKSSSSAKKKKKFTSKSTRKRKRAVESDADSDSGMDVAVPATVARAAAATQAHSTVHKPRDDGAIELLSLWPTVVPFATLELLCVRRKPCNAIFCLILALFTQC